jgi:hypothetical protein
VPVVFALWRRPAEARAGVEAGDLEKISMGVGGLYEMLSPAMCRNLHAAVAARRGDGGVRRRDSARSQDRRLAAAVHGGAILVFQASSPEGSGFRRLVTGFRVSPCP